MNSSLGALGDDFGPSKLIANPLFLQKTNSFAVVQSQAHVLLFISSSFYFDSRLNPTNCLPQSSPTTPLPAFKTFPKNEDNGAASFLFSSPLSAAANDDYDFGQEAIPEEIVPEVTQPQSSSSGRPMASAEIKIPALPTALPPSSPDDTPNDSTQTMSRLPLKQTTKRVTSQKDLLEVVSKPAETLDTTPIDNSPRAVRALNLAKNFPFEVLCAANWGMLVVCLFTCLPSCCALEILTSLSLIFQ